MLDNRRPTTPTRQVRHVTATERQTAIDQLARAVGEHALRQAEIDQRMATRLIELRDELSTAKDEIRSLRAQVETLIQGLSQGLAIGPHAISVAPRNPRCKRRSQASEIANVSKSL